MDIILESDGTVEGTIIRNMGTGDILDVDAFQLFGVIKAGSLVTDLNILWPRSKIDKISMDFKVQKVKDVAKDLSLLWLKSKVDNIYIDFKMVKKPEGIKPDAIENNK